MKVEIKAGNGGSDAEKFAKEFSNALSKHSGVEYSISGKTIIFNCL